MANDAEPVQSPLSLARIPSSDLHDFRFFCLQRFIDLRCDHQSASEYRQIGSFVLRNFAVAFHLFERVHAIPADIPHSDFSLLGIATATFLSSIRRSSLKSGIGIRMIARLRI